MGALVGPIYSEINDSQSPAGVQRAKLIDDLVSFIQQHAENLARPPLTPPIFYSTLIRAVEHAGNRAYWPVRLSDREIAEHRNAALRILLASIAEPVEESSVLGIEAVSLDN